MKAMLSTAPGGPETLQLTDLPDPEPGKGHVVVRVHAAGVNFPDTLIIRDLYQMKPPRPFAPGGEIAGEVVALGAEVDGFAVGDRVGIAWLRHTCGVCGYCRRGAENLCPNSRYTGWDADGGYADFATVPADFAHRLPGGYSDSELAPLLCAGIIGYRSLLRAELPPGGRLGLYGFGGSAHITAQVAIAQEPGQSSVSSR